MDQQVSTDQPAERVLFDADGSRPGPYVGADGRQRRADGKVRMVGPFFRPVSRDWAFGLWIGLSMAYVMSWWTTSPPPTSALGVVAAMFVGLPFASLVVLGVIGATIGMWRGFRLGAREGRGPR